MIGVVGVLLLVPPLLPDLGELAGVLQVVVPVQVEIPPSLLLPAITTINNQHSESDMYSFSPPEIPDPSKDRWIGKARKESIMGGIAYGACPPISVFMRT